MSNIRKQLDKLKKQTSSGFEDVSPTYMFQTISEIKQFLSKNAHMFAKFQAQNELNTIMNKIDSFEKSIRG